MTTALDLVVIGGGSGGLAAAKRAASLGAKVALCEPRDLGGTCVNRGCVPKKMLWQTARHWAERRGLDTNAGIAVGEANHATVMSKITTHIENLRSNFADDLDAAGVQLIRERVKLHDDGAVTAGDMRLTPGRVLIATGAKPVLPDIEGADLTQCSDDVFGWTEMPDRLVIVGGGYIGCEFASIFAAFGVKVVLVQSGPRILPKFDAQAVSHVSDALSELGVDLICGTKPESVRQIEGGQEIILDNGTRLTADQTLCAIGRRPNLACIAGLKDDLTRGSNGSLAVDADFQTSRSGVYAIGDCADRLPLTPVATRDGETFADRAFGDGGDPIDLGLVATAAYTLPAIAQVGEVTGGDRSGASEPLRNQLLALKAAAPNYFHIHQESAPLSGAVLVSNEAPDMIALCAALCAAGSSHDDALRHATAVHPSFAEELVGR